MDFSRIRNYLFLGLLALVTIAFLMLLKPFAYTIFWAAVIASLFYPLFKSLNAILKHRNLSSVLTLLAVFLIIVLPFIILGMLLVRESISLYGTVENKGQFIDAINGALQYVKHNRFTAGLNIDENLVSQKIAEFGNEFSNYVINFIKELTQNSLRFLIMFVLMLYCLFYFIRDGQEMLEKLMYLLPLGDKSEKKLYDKFVQACNSMIKGTLILGGIQGTLGAIVFMLTGVPGAIMWGIIMIIFSLVPAFGAGIIWFPAGVLQILFGHTWQGIFILAVGFLIISTIDNLLRPIIVGKDLSMSPIIVLFSSLGGIAIFGASGFMIGPVIAALFLAFWEMYQEYFHGELSNN